MPAYSLITSKIKRSLNIVRFTKYDCIIHINVKKRNYSAFIQNHFSLGGMAKKIGFLKHLAKITWNTGAGVSF